VEFKTNYRKLLYACYPLLDKKERPILRQAFNIICSQYENKLSLTKEPLTEYVTHISGILINELNLGYISAVSALLSFTDLKNEHVQHFLNENNLSESLAIIESYKKIVELPTDRLINNVDNFTGIMLSLASDVRAILLTLAENLYLLRNSSLLDEATFKITLNKAINIYIPLSHKLGLYKIKGELEEISFSLQEPLTYKQLAKQIEVEINRSRDFIQKFTEPILTDLSRMGIKYTIKSRTKTVSSVHNKMIKQKIPFDEIYDLFAIRIIIDSDPENEKADCWKVYSVVTNLYSPETSRMRDWITMPRPNGYESLHITVKDTTGRWVEVQIRSHRMDIDAELGSAAHWRYKGHKGVIDTTDWMNSVRQILESKDYTEDLLTNKSIATKIPEDVIYVFTPVGDLLKLKEGSTVLDFAFELHTVIGSKCTGGRVNHKIVSIKQKLKNGDVVEIITSKNQTPNRDWLGWVVTTRAKNKIKRYLKEAEFKQAEVGRDILRRKLSQLKMPFNDETVSKLIAYFKFQTSLELFQQLADNKIEPSLVKEILLGQLKGSIDQPVVKEVPKHPDRTSENTILVNESAELQGYILARCCNPVMGDEIFGFVMTGGGIKIHRTNCPNAPRLSSRYPYRIMDAQWSKVAEGSFFISSIHISGIDQLGILNSITELLSNELKVDVRNIALNSKGGKFDGYIKVSVRDSRHIDSLMKKIEGIKGVTSVKRVH
jgi:GTP pyrophosphokinase